MRPDLSREFTADRGRTRLRPLSWIADSPLEVDSLSGCGACSEDSGVMLLAFLTRFAGAAAGGGPTMDVLRGLPRFLLATMTGSV